jgi:hypothetical protein
LAQEFSANRASKATGFFFTMSHHFFGKSDGGKIFFRTFASVKPKLHIEMDDYPAETFQVNA